MDTEDQIAQLTVSNRDLKKTQDQLSKITRLYAFISQVNQHIVRVKDEATLFDNACKMAIEFGKFKMAWIGLFNKPQKKMNLVSQCGIPKDQILPFINAAYQANGPQDVVLHTDTPFFCNNIAHHFPLENWKPFAAKNNIRSCIILPIRKSGAIIGTFNLYETEVGFSNKEEIELLVEVTNDISFALDLFENAKKQKEIREMVVMQERRFRILIENSIDMISLSTSEGSILYASPSIPKQLGYSSEEFFMTSATELIHPEDLDGYKDKLYKILKNKGKSFYSQHRVLHKNGNWIWCEGTVSNMLQEPGIHAFVSNFRDINEAKLAKLRLEFDRNNLMALINNTKDLMWSVDQDFNLITSNEPFDKITKLTSGAVITKGDNVLAKGFSPENTKKYKLLYERAFAGEAFTEIEHTVLPYELWTEISYYPIRKGAEVIGTACYSRDITKRKNQEYLLKKQIKLELENKELEQFAYIASHDLQEPLRTVANYIKVLEEDYVNLLDNTALSHINAINTSIARMSLLIKSLLYHSQLGSHKKLTSVDCKRLVENVMVDLEALLKTSHAIIEVKNLPKLNVYEIELGQVFQNLIANAIKFRKKDTTPKIVISAEKKINEWQFAVTDHGIGISSKYYESIFNIFQRLNAGKEYEGNGIGLANCKKIIEQHQGHIWVESSPAKGTTFYFTIPNLEL